MKIRALLVSLSLLTLVSSAEARVTRLVVEQRESPAFKGQSFGAAGQFEILSGHFTGELDPRDPHNAIITDIQLAPRNARGMVEYTATFAIAKPIDMTKASGVLFYSVPNRGNGGPVGSAEGHVSVVSGWQGDLTPRANLQTISVPVAKNADGSPITGPVFERLIDMPADATTVKLDAAQFIALNYQRPVTLDTSKASLERRASRNGEPTKIPASDWAFADCTSTPFPGTPDPAKICLKSAFNPAFEYDLSYIAKDPLVLGIGYAATRDINSFLRYETQDNPVAGRMKWGVARGNSQSGNFLRSYINLGFNQDEANRIVWEGINPHIASRQLTLNIRFGIGGTTAEPYQPGSDGVVWWTDYNDKTRNLGTAGLLDRCSKTNTCPKIVETFGALEFWYLRVSPALVGTDAKADLPLPANVRRYFFPGTTHGGGRGGFSTAVAAPARNCMLPVSPDPETETMNALIQAMVDWVTKGTEPPPSVYPRLDRHELVAPTKAAMGFPDIPGAPSPDGLMNAVVVQDFGPKFDYNDLSGVISKMPPVEHQTIPMLVPRSDADGSDVGGVPSVLHQAPLGTYLGWNPLATGFDKGGQCILSGGFIPFEKTRAEREAKHDPRLSLEERYKDHAGYVAAVKAAAQKSVAARFLLQEDADRLIVQAEASNVLAEK